LRQVQVFLCLLPLLFHQHRTSQHHTTERTPHVQSVQPLYASHRTFFPILLLTCLHCEVDVNLKESLGTPWAYSDRRTASCSRCYCSRPGLRSWICYCDSMLVRPSKVAAATLRRACSVQTTPHFAGAFWREDTAPQY
jgi:hypothetical protein